MNDLQFGTLTEEFSPVSDKLSKHMTLAERVQADGSAFAISVINSLLREAHSRRASDLHIDPGGSFFIARFRIDGVLHDTHRLPLTQHAEIIARLKVLAGLRTDEHQLPQDGRFQFEAALNDEIDIRLSIVPAHHGESAVLRLLSSRKPLHTFDSLGVSSAQGALLREAASQHHGMILVTGPTGSGKTSTLYSVIHFLNTRQSSIITIEDPVEYVIPGINQISAHRGAGLTFADGLRSILRQDPDVIGVGEIRDRETATIATNAALTGHLVLSTLHTIDAPAAVTRLMDMGIEPYILSSTISLVISQRLVRRVCPACRQRKPLRREHKKLASRHAISPELLTHHYEGRGCVLCDGTGTTDRIGIFEIMVIDRTIREAIERRASAHEIRTLALAQGMTSLLNDALYKVSKGIVPLDEVWRLISHSNS